LLSLLQLGEQAHAISIRKFIAEKANHRVSRGALYRTLDRLEAKGYVGWVTDEPIPERDGYSRRRFQVTAEGLTALRVSQQAIGTLSRGLETVLRKP
jgi:PadR family transcriptional regulator, regulatory protein PadR